jgi:carbonic anhydrase
MTCCDRHLAVQSRRKFVQALTLGGGAMLLSTLPLQARASGQADALLLTCMDYRLENEILAYMDGRGMRDKYDHVVLAGASLGAMTTQKPDWGPTFWQHLDIAIQLHHIHKVIVLDHRDCGAYKTFLGPDAVKTPAAETAVHEKYLHALRAEIKKRHPDLEVELGIMALDGKVQTVA